MIILFASHVFLSLSDAPSSSGDFPLSRLYLEEMT
jgi:hypothetical protein